MMVQKRTDDKRSLSCDWFLKKTNKQKWPMRFLPVPCERKEDTEVQLWS